MLLRAWIPALGLLLQVSLANAAMDAGQVRGLLEKLQGEAEWGEAVFEDGRVRSFRVETLGADSVAVVEIIGALQERSAAYGLDEFRSLRSLGAYRIQPRRAAYQPQKSGLVALLLEAVVPGAGYFYIGESKQGLVLLGLTAAAAATAVTTGESTAAGWAPISIWIKISSLTHLRDQVQAINKSSFQASVELGALRGREATVPGLRLNLTF